MIQMSVCNVFCKQALYISAADEFWEKFRIILTIMIVNKLVLLLIILRKIPNLPYREITKLIGTAVFKLYHQTQRKFTNYLQRRRKEKKIHLKSKSRSKPHQSLFSHRDLIFNLFPGKCSYLGCNVFQFVQQLRFRRRILHNLVILRLFLFYSMFFAGCYAQRVK